MKQISILIVFLLLAGSFFLSQCTQQAEGTASTPYEAASNYDGFESQVKWGEHLVTVGGCHDCHTPKKMTAHGPVLDSTLLLSGHPAQMPGPDIDRKEIESKFLVVANPNLTAWAGVWGVSFTANLTSDETGIGSWQESNFMTAIREGKLKGLSAGRSLLPPMPWEMYKHFTDDELKAVFAYLKSTKPVKNVVPEPLPPVSPPPPAG